MKLHRMRQKKKKEKLVDNVKNSFYTLPYLHTIYYLLIAIINNIKTIILYNIIVVFAAPNSIYI